ncbi:MAG TPA: RNB domain-containing ribonuclease [Acidobacteriaceae bacterium]|nr:RNB domain-containing ribonuclease [Acidobacteriaceae bacterium]
MTDRELLQRIERSAGQRAGYKQLVRELGLGGGRERRLLLEQLERMTARGELIKPDRDHWALPQAKSQRYLLSGRLDVHREGFGFVRPGSRQPGGDDDIFIPPNEINGAMQGDQVLVELAPPRSDGRRSGSIVRILSRRNATVVGIFHYSLRQPAQGNYVTPLDGRILQPILIPFGLEKEPQTAGVTPHRVVSKTIGFKSGFDTLGGLEGMVVDVEITDWPTVSRPARGLVLEVLGREGDFGVDVEIVIRKHHLPHVFPPHVLDEARMAARLDLAEVIRRRDFRGLPIVTIDGETAKDFDDAVFVRRQDNGNWELQVHIADVAQYVTPGSTIDLEARLRGTSVYFPDRAVPMLPQELSSDICSLRPGEDRLVLSCIMAIGSEGEILGYEVTSGVIRSAARMTYTQVHAVISGDQNLRQQFADLVPEFERMYELARLLHRKRQRRGSIDFDLPEPVIEFDAQGIMQSIVRSERTWANRLIEEFMLSANECVASWLQNLDVPSLYRIHEKPEPRRVVEFESLAAGFGYSLGLGPLPVKRVTMKAERRERRGHGPGHQPRQYEIPEDIAVTPRMYQQLAIKIAGKPEERILAHLMLRSLRQARYSEKNEGHFALAAPCYTHFTSPIRRYPDLIVHRIAKAVLASGASGRGVLATHSGTRRKEGPVDRVVLSESELAGIASESSQAERRADEAERELVEWKKVKFMQDRLGDEFDAMIMSVTKYGCFVELDSLFIEGLAPIMSLQGDHFTFRENTRQIIGEHTGRRYSMGDKVRVVLDRVETVQRRLQFSIVEEVAPVRSRSARAKTKAQSGGKSNPYIPPRNEVLRKSKGRVKSKRPGRKRS